MWIECRLMVRTPASVYGVLVQDTLSALSYELFGGIALKDHTILIDSRQTSFAAG